MVGGKLVPSLPHTNIFKIMQLFGPITYKLGELPYIKAILPSPKVINVTILLKIRMKR